MLSRTIHFECKKKCGKNFKTLAKKYFIKENPLQRILNENILKLSYSCTNK